MLPTVLSSLTELSVSLSVSQEVSNGKKHWHKPANVYVAKKRLQQLVADNTLEGLEQLVFQQYQLVRDNAGKWQPGGSGEEIPQLRTGKRKDARDEIVRLDAAIDVCKAKARAPRFQAAGPAATGGRTSAAPEAAVCPAPGQQATTPALSPQVTGGAECSPTAPLAAAPISAMLVSAARGLAAGDACRSAHMGEACLAELAVVAQQPPNDEVCTPPCLESELPTSFHYSGRHHDASILLPCAVKHIFYACSHG